MGRTSAELIEKRKDPPTGWTPEERVEWCYIRMWNVASIARVTGLRPVTVLEIMAEVDKRNAARMVESPDRRKARHIAYNDAIAAEVWRHYRKQGNVRVLRLGLEANGQTQKIHGDHAPTRSVTIDLQARALVNPEVQRRIMANPRARAMLLALEEVAADEQATIDIEAVEIIEAEDAADTTATEAEAGGGG